ncbi:uncharacterized protein LOC119686221 [Teleopsis dalmanni]|uniref:uncharacterized protein LOC119686221 n=1 Tax=Teleopsis dalmanni TaxID=139649 RepID=UPI0018CE4BA5|nr:uncharacterized protein LOC119686221 [Teleopsis dalmanni]
MKQKDENTTQLLILARKKLRKLIMQGKVGPKRKQSSTKIATPPPQVLDTPKLKKKSEEENKNKDIRTIIKERFQMDPNKLKPHLTGKGDASATTYLKRLRNENRSFDNSQPETRNLSNTNKGSKEVQNVESAASSSRNIEEHKVKVYTMQYLNNFQAVRSKELQTIDHLQKFTTSDPLKQYFTNDEKLPTIHNTNKYFQIDKPIDAHNNNKYLDKVYTKGTVNSKKFLQMDYAKPTHSINKYLQLGDPKDTIKPYLPSRIGRDPRGQKKINPYFINDEANILSSKHIHRNIYEEVRSPPRPFLKNKNIIDSDGIFNMWRRGSPTALHHRASSVKVFNFGPRYLLRKSKPTPKRRVTLDTVPELNDFFDTTLDFHRIKPNK